MSGEQSILPAERSGLSGEHSGLSGEHTLSGHPSAAPGWSGSGYQLPTYEFRLPPELDGSRPGEPRPEGEFVYPLIIVGGGLAGLAAACDCAVRAAPATGSSWPRAPRT